MNVRRIAALAASLSIIVASGVPAAADQVPGVPGLNVAVTHVSQKSPVYIVSAPMFQSNQGSPGANYIQCVDFRVLSRKAVNAVRFTIHFRDEFNTEHFVGSSTGGWNLDRRGFFSPGQVVNANHDSSKTYLNDQNESCWVVPTAFNDTGQRNVTKMSIETTRVAFADGTVWMPGQSFDQAFNTNGSPFRAAINVSTRWITAGHAPIEGMGAATDYDFGGDPEQCVSFRNVSNQVVTAVDFAVFYTDGSGNVVRSTTVSHAGTFTAPVLIENKCRNVNLGNADTIRQLRVAEIHVRRVVFNDGTEWHEGDGFTRVFGNNGTPLASPIFVASGGAPLALPTTSPGVTPDVRGFGPDSGQVVAPGMRFGAIAIDSTATYGAVASNDETAGTAAADAIGKCNALAGNNTCVVKVTFSTDRCGAIAKRVLQGVPVVFLATGSSQRAAESAALDKAGATDAGILASGCNT